MDNAAQLATLVRSIAEGLVVVANDSLGDQSSEVVGVVPADTLNSNSDVGSRDSVVTDPNIRANEVGLPLGQDICLALGSLRRQVREVLLGHLDELLMRDTTSADENHAVCGVVVLDVVDKLGASNIADVLTGAEDGTAQGVALEGSSVKVIKDNLLELLLNLLSLAEDDITFPLNGGGIELGVLEDVLQDVDALGHVLVQGLGEVDGVLALFSSHR